jgi:hypothetical protein
LKRIFSISALTQASVKPLGLIFKFCTNRNP